MSFQEESSNKSTVDIAIIGVDCTFPGAGNLEEYYKLIISKQDAITKVPAERWIVEDYYHPKEGTSGKMSTQWGGFIRDVDRFDADYFSISNREAKTIDPQHRLLLQSSCKALEHANINPHALAGSNTSVFVGICHSDYEKVIYDDFSRIGGYHGPATYQCIASNRISFSLDLRGPSMSIDTACSSSLVALHTACRSLKLGESDLSIVGGINLLLRPQETIALSHAGMMGDRCHTFSEKAKGYVRAEGCATIVLKRLDAAERDNDRILAVVKGSAVNQNGLSYGITAPNGLAQQAVINTALNEAQLRPQDINMIEAQGVGTSLGDPIEIAALVNVLSGDRELNDRCALGSVKSNIGHSEGASGIAGIVKAILAIQHRQILPHRDIETTNPLVAKHLHDKPFYFPSQVVDWAQDKALTVGVSAFGFGGTNAHVILQEHRPNAQTEQSETNSVVRESEILVVSAQSEESLEGLLKDYQSLLSKSANELSLRDVCATAAQKRQHRDIRIAFKVTSIDDALEQINDALNRKIWSAEKKKRHSIGFMFGHKIAAEKLEECLTKLSSFPAFYSAVLNCVKSLDKVTGNTDSASITLPTLLSKYLSKSIAALTVEDAELLQSFVVQYAAAKVWESWGLAPKKVNGIGVGSVVASVIADIFSLDTAIQLIVLLGSNNESEEGRKAEIISTITSYLPIELSTAKTSSLFDRKFGDVEEIAAWLSESFSCDAQGASAKEYFDAKISVVVGIGYVSSVNDALVVNTVVSKNELWSTIMDTMTIFYRYKIPVNWQSFYQGCFNGFVSIPTYRFSRNSFWFNTTLGYQPQSNMATTTHPLLGDVRSIAYDGREFLSAQTKILVSQYPYIFDHTLYGKIVFPAAAFIEIFVAASDSVFGKDCGMLSDVSIREALIVKENTANQVIYLQSRIELLTDDTYQISIYSTANNPSALGSNWMLHAHAKLLVKEFDLSINASDNFLMSASLSDSSAYYQRLTEIGLCYGESMRNIASIADIEGRVTANITISHEFSDQRYTLNPALIDGCLQAAGKLCLKTTSRSALVPVGFRQITKLADLGDNVHCFAFLSEQKTDKKKRNLIDMLIVNEDGEIALMIEGMHLVSARRNSVDGSKSMSVKRSDHAALDYSNVYALPQKTSKSSADNKLLLKISEGMDEDDRIKIVCKYLQNNLAKVLELPKSNIISIDEGFFNIGMTSLLVNELKNRLEIDLGLNVDSSILFDYPNIRALSKYLLTEVTQEKSRSVEVAQKPISPSFIHSTSSNSKPNITLDEYNDEDLERLLVMKLNELEV